jgi:hypothetical protein
MRIALPPPRRPIAGARPRRVWTRRILVPLLLVLAYLAWPYLTLWRLDRALVADDQAALDSLVDLGAIRGEILRKVNKESPSLIGPLSDAFIDWLEQGIRRNGTETLDRQVDLAWVRQRLLSHSPPGGGLTPSLTHAFFQDPLHFVLRVGPPDRAPVLAVLSFRGLGWRLAALYY